MLRGYDLSAHNATPNLDGIAFVILRATIGTAKDARYAEHYDACRKAGVVTMAYHFNGPTGSDVEAQAAMFLETARDADFLWLDQERYNATTEGFTDAEAQRFIDAIRKERPCGLYHSSSGFGGVSCDAKWVADWRDASEAAGYPRNAAGTAEFPAWDVWQYDGGGADGLDNDLWNPARPIADLLRLGYLTEADHETEVAALKAHIVDLKQDVGDLTDSLADAEAQRQQLLVANRSLAAANAALTDDLTSTQDALAAAPGIERERIAQAEAERIRST